MQIIGSKWLIVLLLVVTALPAWAAKEDKKKKGEGMPGPLLLANEKISGLNLKDDLKTKVDAVLEEFKPKFAAAEKKAEGNITDDQKKALHDAIKNAKADGKKGKDLKQVADDALKLSDEQKNAKAEGMKELAQLTQEFKKSLSGILTAEQVGELGLDGKKKGKKDN